MRQVTYQEYLNNPAIREQIEAEARRARSVAIRTYTAMPFAWLFGRKPVVAPQLNAA